MWATLTCDGRLIEHDDPKPSLEQMQAVVDAGNGNHYVERVELKHGIDMWVNEEGLYAFGTPPDPKHVNGRAAMLGAAAGSIEPGLPIHGDACFTGGVDDDGETVGLSEPQLAYLRQVADIEELVQGSNVWSWPDRVAL